MDELWEISFFELFGAASVFDFIIRWEGHFFGMLADTWA